MIDFHCHLDLFEKPFIVTREAGDAGIYVLSVTTTPKAWHGTLQLSKGYPRIRTALGFHPEVAHERANELPLFETLLPEAKYVGEVGLDGSPQLSRSWNIQLRVFQSLLRMTTRVGGRIMSIHSRRAAKQVLDELTAEPDAGTPVLHWFSGSKSELRRAIDMGCWFSVGPAMLRGKRGQELVRSMPRERVLTESDGPFASDANGPFTPSACEGALTMLADCWSEPRSETKARMLEALRTLVSPR